ncbi:hypothetical protein AMJ57_01780, partial [Parcubacteria bacterium SG8_24]
AIVFVPLSFGARPLTEPEISVVRTIFGTSIDLDKVRIRFGGPLTWFSSSVTIGNVISFPAGRYDGSGPADLAWLVHELVHVWQYQNFGWGYVPESVWEQLTESDAYVVHYDATISFLDYDIEEQAVIVAEYFLDQRPEYEPYLEELRLTQPVR